MPSRAIVLGLAVVASVVVLPRASAGGGETPSRPQARVVPAPPASSAAQEPDDLPGPPPEVVTDAGTIDLPPVPSFDRRAPDGAPAVESAAASPAGEAASAVATEPPLRRVIDRRSLQASIDHLSSCNTALAGQRYDAVIAACRAATEIWDGNHLAWYRWATAHMARREWSLAQAAIEHAVALRPDQGMYQLYHGIALYEAARRQVEDEARRARKDPDKASLDPRDPRLGAVRSALAQAIRLAPDLWRAHYYLGCVLRDQRDARHAAEQLGAAIKLNPGHGRGYRALAELYRRWGYLEQALAVATLGTTSVSIADSADLWFEVGLCHDAMHAGPRAIEAFSQAIAIRPDDARLKLYRGWLHVVAGDLAAARLDLAGAMSSADPSMEATRQLAKRLLARLASENSPRDGTTPTCPAVKACAVYSAPVAGWIGNDWASRL